MSEQRGIRVLLADDHPILRAGLRKLLEAEPAYQVVGEAADGEQALQMARAIMPDILLLDLAMPRLTGLEVLSEMATGATPVRTIILTAAIDKPEIVTALQLGARGIVLKDSATELLFKSMDSVIKGEHWVGREAVSDLVQALRSQMSGPPNGPSSPAKRFGLTRRELEVVGAVVSGYSNREIAAKFSLSEDTVKHHLSKIFDKVGASNRLELALFSVHHRLLEGQDVLPS
jgi:two-component system nitrate/nitrite response regulator NarL